MVKRITSVLFLVGVPVLSAVMFGSQLLMALPYGSGAYGTCTYDTCDIEIISGSPITLDITPTESGVNTTAKDEVVVSTGATTGYTLTFHDSDTNTSLTNGSEFLAASSGTQGSPITLELNTWGYRVDGLASFGSGPTSAQVSDSSASYIFAGVPASDQTSHTLKVTSEEAEPSDTTEVWYGVRMDTSKPSGTYSGTVVYTAVTNE